MTRSITFAFLPSTVAIGALCASTGIAQAVYLQTDLVSDVPGLAELTDSGLVNPWGVSFRGTSPFWISNQGSDTTTLYAVTGPTTVSKVDINPPSGFVGIPRTASGPQGPTGQVSNSNASAFDVGNGGNGHAADFIFANLNGTISAWNGGQDAFVQATTPGAVYTGLAINHADTRLYAANVSAGAIDVFNRAFAPVHLGANAFATPSAISALGLVPFNVQDIGRRVYVTYALPSPTAQTTATAGDGAVAVFSESGAFRKMIVGGPLASPWGVAFAPSAFGTFSGDLLVGNFSYVDGGIDAFNPATDAFVGSIAINPGAGQSAGGLWDLTFGTGGRNGNPNALYFTDGINGQSGGLFGAITSVPEPSTWGMMALGFAGLGFFGHRSPRRRSAIA